MPANIWTYHGEAGKRLGATVRPFTGQGGVVTFASMETDRFTWAVPLRNLVPSSEEYPQVGEVVSLYRNGVRFFHGTTLRPDQNGFFMNLEVVGPWHWLETIPLSTPVALDAASGGGLGQRATIGFPTQTMTTSIGTLFDRCIALGAPFTKGIVPTTFSCIPVTLNQGYCSDAVAELCRLIGDMMLAFDYSGSGLPIANVTRRLAGLAVGSAAVETININQKHITPGQFKIVPMDTLRVSQVVVPYITRKFDGTRLYQEQKAGTYELGHVLLLTASGEALDTFLPEEKLDSYFLQTVATSGTAFKNWVLNASGSLVKAGQVAGVSPQSLPLNIGPASLSYQTDSSDLPGTNKTIQIAGASFLNSQGQPVSTSGKNILVSSNLPEWLKEQYVVEEVTIVCPVYYEWKEQQFPSGTTYQVPVWWHSVQWASADLAGYKGTSSTNYASYRVFIHNAELRAFLINTSSSGSTIYRQPDYTFIQPPAGFAAGLLAARNWTPYKGPIGWKEQDPGAVQFAGKLVNVVGAHAEFETMRAMVSSVEYDIGQGNTRVNLGPPQRHSFPDLLRQVRANSNEQIVYL